MVAYLGKQYLNHVRFIQLQNGTDITNISTSATFVDGDTKSLPTQKAAKTYIETRVSDFTTSLDTLLTNYAFNTDSSIITVREGSGTTKPQYLAPYLALPEAYILKNGDMILELNVEQFNFGDNEQGVSDLTLFTSSSSGTILLNGTFQEPYSWTLGTNTVITSNELVITSGVATTTPQKVNSVADVTYSTSFDITTYIAGNIRVDVGSTNGTLRNGLGTFAEQLVCSAPNAGLFTIDVPAAFTGHVDNFILTVANYARNPNFTSGSFWVTGAGHTIAAGVLSISTGSASSTTQVIPLIKEGSRYTTTFTISNYAAGKVRLRFGSNAGTWRSADGTFIEELDALGVSDFDTMYIETSIDGFVGDVDTIIIAEKDIARNGTFNNLDWVLGVGTAINNNQLEIDFNDPTGSLTYQNISGLDTKSYETEYTVSGYVSGTIKIAIGTGTNTGFPRTANGSYLDVISPIAPHAELLYISVPSAFTGNMDSISCKESMVFNADFSGVSGYVLGAGMTYDPSTYSLNIVTLVPSTTSQVIGSKAGISYRISYRISVYSSGSIRFGIGSTFGALRSSAGIFSDTILVAGPSDDTLFIDVPSDFDGVIDYVSIIPVDMVLNGNFTALTDWTTGVGHTLTGAVLDISTVSNTNSSQNILAVAGRKYKITYTVLNYVSGSVRVRIGSTGFGSYKNMNGTFTEIVTAGGVASNTLFIEADTLGFVGQIDNISVEHADLLSNGDFSNIETWYPGENVDSGITVTGGVANFSVITPLQDTPLYQVLSIEQNKTYQLQYTISNYTTGQLYVQMGNYIGPMRSANGTYTETIVADMSPTYNVLRFIAPANGTLSADLDNVLLTTINELVNGDFSTDITWIFNNLSFQDIADEELQINASGATNISQTVNTNFQDDYIITYTISNYVSGGIQAQLGTSVGSLNSADGTYTQTLNANGLTYQTFKFVIPANFVGTIDNVDITTQSNICVVNDVSFDGTTLSNAYTKTVNNIKVREIGVDFLPFDGKLIAVKNGTEIFLGTLDLQKSEIINCTRGPLIDKTLAYIRSQSLLFNQNLSLMQINWVYAKDDLTFFSSSREPFQQATTPISPVDKDVWFDTSTQIWKVYDAGLPGFTTEKVGFVGLVITDFTKAVAAYNLDYKTKLLRFTNFDYPIASMEPASVLSSNNGTSLPQLTDLVIQRLSNTQVQIFDKSFVASGFNTVSDQRFQPILWDITVSGILQTGFVEAASTTYYMYINNQGLRPFLSPIYPLWIESLGVYKHPENNWICVGEIYNNVSSNFDTDAVYYAYTNTFVKSSTGAYVYRRTLFPKTNDQKVKVYCIGSGGGGARGGSGNGGVGGTSSVGAIMSSTGGAGGNDTVAGGVGGTGTGGDENYDGYFGGAWNAANEVGQLDPNGGPATPLRVFEHLNDLGEEYGWGGKGDLTNGASGGAGGIAIKTLNPRDLYGITLTVNAGGTRAGVTNNEIGRLGVIKIINI